MSWMGPILSLSYKPDLWSLKRPFSLSDVIYEVREISARENVESRVDSFSRRVEDIFLRTNGTIRLTGFHYGENSCKNYISHAFLSSLFANDRPRDFFAIPFLRFSGVISYLHFLPPSANLNSYPGSNYDASKLFKKMRGRFFFATRKSLRGRNAITKPGKRALPRFRSLKSLRSSISCCDDNRRVVMKLLPQSLCQ